MGIAVNLRMTSWDYLSFSAKQSEAKNLVLTNGRINAISCEHQGNLNLEAELLYSQWTSGDHQEKRVDGNRLRARSHFWKSTGRLLPGQCQRKSGVHGAQRLGAQSRQRASGGRF